MKNPLNRYLHRARKSAGRFAWRVRERLAPDAPDVLAEKQRRMYWSVNGAFESILGQGWGKITMPPDEGRTVRVEDPLSGSSVSIRHDSSSDRYLLEKRAGDGWTMMGEFRHLVPATFRALRYFLEASPDHRGISPGGAKKIFLPMENGKPVPKCIHIGEQWTSHLHRSGWRYAVDALESLHNEDGVFFDGFVESTFLWGDSGRVYRKPWVGVIHNPPNTPKWAAKGTATNRYLFHTDRWKKSIGNCKGIFVLSDYHRRALKGRLKVPVSTICHPTETPRRTFSVRDFRNNPEPMLIQIGYWLRNPNSLYKLDTKKLAKVRLDTGHPWEEEVRENLPAEDLPTGTVRVLPRVSNEEYDELLSRNVVFLDLFDSSANNAIIECIVRNTPLLVNHHPAVVEYLGENYPLYYRSLDEAERKIDNFSFIERAHRYLKGMDKERFTQEGFLWSVIRSEVYRSLRPTATHPFVLFAQPRSGSTTLMDILDAHGEIRMLNEPFNPGRASWGDRGRFHAYREEVTDIPSLDRCLDGIYSYHTGMKHLIYQLDEDQNERLLEREGRRIFLYRQNVLQAVVSSVLAEKTRIWEAHKETMEDRELPSLDIRELSKRISWQRRLTEHYRRFFEKKNLPYFEITHEEIFGSEVTLEGKVGRIRDLYSFLGTPEPDGEVMERVRGLLDPEKHKLNTEARYRRIPNVDEIETKLGNSETGFLFPRSTSGEGTAGTAQRWPRHTPFRDPSSALLVVHACHHKTGTHWIQRILRQIAGRWDLRLVTDREIAPGDLPDILFDPHTALDITALPPFRGSHMIRDPRDIVVSGYFYHLWSHESWAHIPRPRWGGKTFQKHLLSLGREEGFMAEIDRLQPQFETMGRWDYDDSRFFELRYETLMAGGEEIFPQLFEHYGFHPDAVGRAVETTRESSFKARAGRSVGEVREGDVMRSGRSGQWREYFTDRVKERFVRSTGDLLQVLGYETGDQW